MPTTGIENIPQPPFQGIRHMQVNTNDVLDQMKTGSLFRGRWGYKKGTMSNSEYDKLLETTVLPEFEAIKKLVISDNLIQPQILYGWFPCVRRDESLVVNKQDKQFVFPFPRQHSSPNLSLVDFFGTNEKAPDMVGFFLVTIGHTLSETSKKLYKANNYHQYLLLHGFGVQAAETLASYCHTNMKKEIGVNSGNRYSFGYSACPELDLQQTLFDLLEADSIGVTLTQSMQMIPEQSVSAMLVHHPQANYFAV